MSVTAEQQSLMTAIVERIAKFQEVVRRALPGNTLLHEAFRVGAPEPSTAAEAAALGRAVEPAAREYKAILLQRGIDAASLSQFSRMVGELERLAAAAPAPAPAAAAEPEPVEKKAPKKAPGKARRS